MYLISYTIEVPSTKVQQRIGCCCFTRHAAGPDEGYKEMNFCWNQITSFSSNCCHSKAILTQSVNYTCWWLGYILFEHNKLYSSYYYYVNLYSLQNKLEFALRRMSFYLDAHLFIKVRAASKSKTCWRKMISVEFRPKSYNSLYSARISRVSKYLGWAQRRWPSL